MKLRLIASGIGVYGNLDVIIKDNTVIAGKNNLGKSQISKLLFSILDTCITYIGYSRTIKEELRSLSDEDQNRYIKSYYEDLGYVGIENGTEEDLLATARSVRFSKTLTKIFKEDYEADLSGVFVELYSDDKLIFSLNDRAVYINVLEIPVRKIIYISSPAILLYSELIFTNKSASMPYDYDLIKYLKYSKTNHLAIDSRGTTFYDNQPITTLGSGIGIIAILEELNSINDDSMILIDEPEGSLHSEWQVQIAKIIKEMKFPTVTTTHSSLIIKVLRGRGERRENYSFIGIKDKGVVEVGAKDYDYTLSLDQAHVSGQLYE